MALFSLKKCVVCSDFGDSKKVLCHSQTTMADQGVSLFTPLKENNQIYSQKHERFIN